MKNILKFKINPELVQCYFKMAFVIFHKCCELSSFLQHQNYYLHNIMSKQLHIPDGTARVIHLNNARSRIFHSHCNQRRSLGFGKILRLNCLVHLSDIMCFFYEQSLLTIDPKVKICLGHCMTFKAS